MADVTGVSSTTNNSSSSNLSQVMNDQLDKDAFLSLLITQLQYQDPMKPMEDREFVSQLAQFSSLEQMQELNSQFEIVSAGMIVSNATSFVGRTITAQGPADAEPFTGKVSAVIFEDGQAKLIVDNTKVELSWLTRVE